MTLIYWSKPVCGGGQAALEPFLLGAGKLARAAAVMLSGPAPLQQAEDEYVCHPPAGRLEVEADVLPLFLPS